MKLTAACSSAKGFQVKSVTVNVREVCLGCWLVALCPSTHYPKGTRKNSSWEEEGINALCLDWSISGWIAWRGHWFVKENRSVTATYVYVNKSCHQIREVYISCWLPKGSKGSKPRQKIRSGVPQGVGWRIRHLPAAPASPLAFSHPDPVLLLDWAHWNKRVRLALRKPTSL